MSFGNLAEQRDLQPLFGKLTPERNERLLERLLTVDSRLSRSEEHTSELQSQSNLVCRLLLEKKKKKNNNNNNTNQNKNTNNKNTNKNKNTNNNLHQTQKRIFINETQLTDT